MGWPSRSMTPTPVGTSAILPRSFQNPSPGSVFCPEGPLWLDWTGQSLTTPTPVMTSAFFTLPPLEPRPYGLEEGGPLNKLFADVPLMTPSPASASDYTKNPLHGTSRVLRIAGHL